MAENHIILLQSLHKNVRFYGVFCTLFNGRLKSHDVLRAWIRLLENSIHLYELARQCGMVMKLNTMPTATNLCSKQLYRKPVPGTGIRETKTEDELYHV
jgi:hypothetical protein